MRLRAPSWAIAVVAVVAPAPAFGAWSAPAWVSARDDASYSQPDTDVGAGGRALTAFVRTPAGSASGAARVQVVTRPATTARWSAPLVLSARGARAPRVAINARGDAVAVWMSGRSLVAAARRGPVGKWAPAGAIVAGGPIQDMRLTIDRVGRPAVVWSERRGDDFLVRTANRASPRVAWTVRQARISTPGPTPPSLAISRSAAMVAWVDGSNAHAARTVGGVFERPVEVSSQGAGTPGVGLSPQGGMLAAWSVDLPGGTSVVLVSERGLPSRGWSASQDAGIGAAPLVAINERGDAVVSWALAPAGSPQGIEASTRRAGARWAASTVVARRSCDCALTVGNVGIDDAGTALVGWRREEGDGDDTGGTSSLAPGADEWVRAAVSPGRTAAAPAVAGGVRGGVTAWAEAGKGGGVRAATLQP